MGRMWKSLKVRAKEACEHCKQRVMDHSSRKLEDLECPEKCRQCEILENKESFGNLELEVILAIFWKRTRLPLCPENLSETEFKALKLIWWRKCEDGTTFMLCHGYCSLFLLGFTVTGSDK